MQRASMLRSQAPRRTSPCCAQAGAAWEAAPSPLAQVLSRSCWPACWVLQLLLLLLLPLLRPVELVHCLKLLLLLLVLLLRGRPWQRLWQRQTCCLGGS